MTLCLVQVQVSDISLVRLVLSSSLLRLNNLTCCVLPTENTKWKAVENIQNKIHLLPGLSHPNWTEVIKKCAAEQNVRNLPVESESSVRRIGSVIWFIGNCVTLGTCQKGNHVISLLSLDISTRAVVLWHTASQKVQHYQLPNRPNGAKSLAKYCELVMKSRVFCETGNFIYIFVRDQPSPLSARIPWKSADVILYSWFRAS